MKRFTFIISFVLLSLLISSAANYTDAAYRLRRQIFSAGKTVASSPSFSISGVAGEIIPDRGESPNFITTTQFIPPPDGCCIGLTGNFDGDPADVTDIGDITAMIDYLFITGAQAAPECIEEGNIDGDPDGIIDIGDLTKLIAYLFIAPYPLPAEC